MRATFRAVTYAAVSLARRAPLVAVLAAVGFVELVFNRILSRLIHVEFLQPRSSLTRVVDGIGLFTFHLVGVLAVLTLLAGLVRVATGPEFRPGARASLPLIGSVFTALAGLGTLFRLTPSLSFHLQLSFFFLGLLLVLATLASHATKKIKVGTLLLFAVAAARLLPQALSKLAHAPTLTALGIELFNNVTMAGIAAGTLLFVPRRARSYLSPALTFVVVVAAALFIRKDWETAARVAAYGFGVDLSLTPWGQLLCLAALAGATFATLTLLRSQGTARLRGYGLLLLAAGGLHMELPYELVLVALGFFCLAASAVRTDGQPISREAFDGVVKHAAAALGAPKVTVTGEPGFEVARVHAPAGGTSVEVVVARRSEVISDVEISVGDTPPREPSFAIERHEARGLGPHPAGARVQTEDPEFDATFAVHDKRGAGAAVLDEDMRRRMLALVRGWLGVWPQRGVRYRATELAAGDDALPELIALVRELAQRTA